MQETKTGPPISMLMTYERILAEASQESRKLIGLIEKLERVECGSEAYYNLTPEIAAAATVLRTKAQSIERMTDDLEDAKPDE